MKEDYMKAELEIVDICPSDVIVTSETTEPGTIQTIDGLIDEE